ncbi:MAG: hypothetical protein ACI9ND_000239 [Yoonia sp.]|jgi:hypothetical protein
MAGSTKILTVSYGTFSCTLEGFDDSFHSMKAIAEYFRDLAQDDRYFGAEPPVPDAEMLARIAEREISRRVEAKIDGKGIRLRAQMSDEATTANGTNASVAMPPKVEAPTAADSPSSLMPAAPLMPSAFQEPTADPEIEAPVTFSAQPPNHPDAESVAAKLQRIRAVVGKPSAPETEAYEDTSFTDDETSQESIETKEVDLTAEVEDATVAVEITDEFIFASEETHAASEEYIVEQSVVADTVSTDIAPMANEAVADDALAAETIADTDDQVAEEIAVVEAIDEVSEIAIIKAVAAEAVAVTIHADVETTAADAPSDVADLDVPVAAETAPIEGQKLPPARARIVRLRKDKPAQVITAPIAEDETPDDTKQVAQRVAAALTVDVPVVEDPNFETPELVVAVAETSSEGVAKVEVEDADAAVFEAPAPVAHEEPAQQTPKLDEIRAAVAAAIPAGNLSDEDEDDLLRELAAVAEDVVTIEDVEPETAEIVVEEIAEAPAATPDVVESPVRSGREILPAADDAAVSRIMTQTDEALNEPTGSRRRNAIAQLKAAVAATEAARQLGDTSADNAQAQEPFRDDLEQAVRPHRPESPVENQLRSERPRSAPLKLVASQRVDEDEPAAAEVQPRRVATQPIDTAEGNGFAQFAAQMGATELPDLLEAAAAYTSFVEGVEAFSRPQIMKKVQLTTEEGFSREDGLRSFGTLLRQGRISKVRNGRFQISEQTRFRPDARSA